MNAKKVFAAVIVLISVLNLAGMIGLYCSRNDGSDGFDTVEYTLYVGLNDKDTFKQEMTDDAAVTVIKSILAKYVDGYTLMNAQGVWADESGHEVNENTVVCYINAADEAAVHSAADELIGALNQQAILIKKNRTDSEYYEGRH